MKKGIIFCLIILQLFWFTNPIFSQDDFKIIKISGDNLVANRGSNHNIEKNQKYYIIRQGETIGIAIVIVLKPDICGLIQTSGKQAYIGDKLQLTTAGQDIFQEIEYAKKQRKKSNRSMIVGVLFIIGGAALVIIGTNRSEKIEANGYTIAEKKNPDDALIVTGGTMALIGLIAMISGEMEN